MNLKEKYQLTESGEKGLKKAIISSVFMFLSIMLPIILVFEFSDNILKGEVKSLAFYLFLMMVIIVLMIFALSFNYESTYGCTYKESRDLRIRLVHKFQKIPLSYFDKFDLSDLAQTIMKDIAIIEHALSHAIPDYYGSIILIFFIGILSIISSPILGIIIFGFNILSIAFVLLSKKFFIKGWEKDYKSLREITNSIQNLIDLNSEIRIYNMEDEVLSDVNNLIDNSEKLHFEHESKIGSYCIGGSVILNISIGVTILVGSYLYLNGNINILYLIGFIMMAVKLAGATNLMFLNIEEIIFLNPTIERLKDINNQKEFVGENIIISNCNTEFKNVEFSYSNETKVIDNLSFKSLENTVTALVGPSGCGKTTVIKLLSRLYEYNSGLISIGGVDISKILSDNLYEKVTIVFQNVVLFNGTIMENIRLGRYGATDEEVIKASKDANCHDFIMKLKDGYNTLIGENGSMLSGGERQRLSIARAFLKNAPIIILDEISASLDVENEMKIQESLNKLIQNKTVFIISHRMKSIENVSNILVMDKGKKVGFGNHKELLEKCDIYRNMVEKSKLSNEYIY